MSPARFRECLALLHWSNRVACDAMNLDERTLRRYANGQRDVPPWIAEPLEHIAQAHARWRFPTVWPERETA